MDARMSEPETIWPSNIRRLDWPAAGIEYSYPDSGYVQPQRLDHWLNSAFGFGKGRATLFNGRLYIKAPRKPTQEEYRWLQGERPEDKVHVAEIGGYLYAP